MSCHVTASSADVASSLSIQSVFSSPLFSGITWEEQQLSRVCCQHLVGQASSPPLPDLRGGCHAVCEAVRRTSGNEIRRDMQEKRKKESKTVSGAERNRME